MSDDNLNQEWALLQTQYDSYEKYSLLIKLIHLFFAGLVVTFGSVPMSVVFIALSFWLQDGIWKTFQSRIEKRLLRLEHLIGLKQEIDEETTNQAFQFNSQFLQNRGSHKELIKEYIKNALKPTVAFPHVILVFILMIV